MREHSTYSGTLVEVPQIFWYFLNKLISPYYHIPRLNHVAWFKFRIF
jgi:hypothetical protein